MILIDWLLVVLAVAFVIVFRRAVFTSVLVACFFFGALVVAAFGMAVILVFAIWGAFKAEVTK